MSTEGVPRAHELLHKVFGIQYELSAWGHRGDASDIRKTPGEVTETPNVWTRWILEVDRQGARIMDCG